MSTSATPGAFSVDSPETATPVRDFLDSIDPMALDSAALEWMGGLGGPTVGEAFLMALKRMAEEWDGA